MRPGAIRITNPEGSTRALARIFLRGTLPSNRVSAALKLRFEGGKKGLQGKKRARIAINSGFFENHRCFFSEITHNVSSLFAVVRIVPNIISGEELNGWKSNDESSISNSNR